MTMPELIVGKEYSLNGGPWVYVGEYRDFYTFSKLVQVNEPDERVENYYVKKADINREDENKINAQGELRQIFRDGRTLTRKSYLQASQDLVMARLEYEDSLEERLR